MQKLRRAFEQYNATRARESWAQYFGGLAYSARAARHGIANGSAWRALKRYANSSLGNATDTVVSNDSPLPEEFYNA